MTKLGNGTLTLTGASNNYSGLTIIAGGKLLLGTVTAAGSGAVDAEFVSSAGYNTYPVTGTAVARAE